MDATEFESSLKLAGYQDSVTLLCLLVMTGNYWDPTTIGK